MVSRRYTNLLVVLALVVTALGLAVAPVASAAIQSHGTAHNTGVTPLAPICPTVSETLGLPIQGCFPPENGNQSQAFAGPGDPPREIVGAALSGPKIVTAGSCSGADTSGKWCTTAFVLSLKVPGSGAAKEFGGFGVSAALLTGTSVMLSAAQCKSCNGAGENMTYTNPTSTWCPVLSTASCPSSSPSWMISGLDGVYTTLRVCATGLQSLLYNDGSYGNFTACLQIRIQYGPNKAPPTATFTAIQDDDNPYKVAFDGSNSTASDSASITKWSWDFGDGDTSDQSGKVTHTFKKDDHYNVTLTVTDSRGQKGSYTVGLDISGLVVRLDAGETNGKLFTVQVTVKNGSATALHDVAFTDPGAITVDTSKAVAGSAGSVINVEGPDPVLPSDLDPGQSTSETVAFAVHEQGGVDLDSSVSAKDASNKKVLGKTSAAVQIGVKKPSDAELLQQYSDYLIDASQQVGTLFNSAQQRMGDVLDWATGQSAGGGLPVWLTSSVNAGTTPPTDASLPAPAGWKVLAARAAGLDDSALAWLPDNPTTGLQLYLTMEKSAAAASANVLKTTAVGARDGLANAAAFYGQLSSGGTAFQTAASQQLQGLVDDLGTAAAPKIAVLGAVLAASHDDLPGSVPDLATNPAVQAFTKNSNAVIDSALQSAETGLVAGVKLAKTDPNAAAAKIGTALGTTTTTIGVTVVTSEFGSAMVGRASSAIEASMSAADSATALDASTTLVNPATTAGSPGAPLIAQGSRQTLESLGAETPITIDQLESLGGFYGGDASKVQQIIKDVKSKYGVNVEVQVRPGNPASLQYYADGTGVPKPEWIKPKATEWTDVILGAPPESLGKATLYEPVLPPASVMNALSEADQATIQARYATQKDLYAASFDPKGGFQKLLADSATKEGATQSVALGTDQVTGLHYSLQDIPGHPGAKYIIDDAAGGKYVLSDADYQAVVSADTGSAIPAAAQRGPIELYVLNRFKSDTVSFGGHGWTVSGFDLPSQYSKPFLQFATGSMNPTDARSTIAWWLNSQTTQPKWLTELAQKIGHPVGVDDLMGLFSPGQFVIKFNGTTMRVGYGATLGK